MISKRIKRHFWTASAGCTVLVLGGCSNFSSTDKEVSGADFTSAWSDDNTLVKPPNLLVDAELQLLQIDNETSGRLLPSVSQARLKHEGSLYWLEVDLAPEIIWTRARSFWLSQGFSLDTEIPEVGILETDWRQDRSRILGTGITKLLDAAFERLHDTGERYRFRTRIERGDKEGTTFIFLSSRLVQEKATLGRIEFHVLPHDQTLEAEMLRRMLIYFRTDDETIVTPSKIKDISNQDKLFEISGTQITVFRNRADTWRRLIVALDRSGFTSVNADKDEGVVLLRSADLTISKNELGFFEQFFAGGQKDGESYEVELRILSSDGERTVIALPDDDNGKRFAPLIADHL